MEDILKQILAKLETLEQGQQAQGKELKELRQGQDTLIGRVGKLEKGQEKISGDLTKLSLHVEGELTEKIRGLYDARGVTLDSLDDIKENQKDQNARLDTHWQEIMVLKTKRR